MLFRDIHDWFMNWFNERSRMFITYLVQGLVEFMVVHELALVHEIFEFMTVHEQLMFMNKVRVHEKNKFLNSWTSMKVSFVVQKYSWTVQEHVCERSRTFIVFCSPLSPVMVRCLRTPTRIPADAPGVSPILLFEALFGFEIFIMRPNNITLFC